MRAERREVVEFSTVAGNLCIKDFCYKFNNIIFFTILNYKACEAGIICWMNYVFHEYSSEYPRCPAHCSSDLHVLFDYLLRMLRLIRALIREIIEMTIEFSGYTVQ